MRFSISKKNTVLLSVAIALVISILSPLSSFVSAKTQGEMNPKELAQSYTYISGISWCIKNVAAANRGGHDFGDDDAKNGTWFATGGGNDTSVVVGYIDGSLESDANEAECNSLINKAYPLWGYGSALELLCSFYNKDEGGKRLNGSGCIEGSGDFARLSDIRSKNDSDNFKAAVYAKVYGGKAPNADTTRYNALKYELYLAAFIAEKGCSASAGLGTGDEKFNYRNVTVAVPKTTSTSDVETQMITQQKNFNGVDKGIKKSVFTDLNTNNVKQSCEEIAKQIDQLARYSVAFYADNPQFLEQAVNENLCLANPTAEGCSSDSTTSCAVEGIGWILCPMLSFVSTVTDQVYGIVDGFLTVDVGLIETNSGTYTAWSQMRNLANAGFVIIFLIVIFSQLTGLGLSNYGVKKILPKLIVVAILINISFYVMQLAVDISNIIGGSLKNFISDIPVFKNEDSGFFGMGNTFTDVATKLMAGQALVVTGAVAVAGTVYFGGLGLFVMIVISAILAVVIALLVLAVRQTLIVLLIVIAPLAFLAMILPNTKKWYDQWKKIFIALLVVYPMIALVFGASALAANVIASSSDGTGMGITIILSLAVATVPLFLVIPMVRSSLNAIPALGNLAQKLSKTATGGLNNSIRSRGKQMRTNVGNSFRSNAMEGGFGKVGRRIAGGRSRQAQKSAQFAGEVQRAEAGYVAETTLADSSASVAARAAAVSAQHKLSEEEIANIMTLDKHGNKSPTDHLKTLRDSNSSHSERVAAIRAIGATGGQGDVNQLAGVSSMQHLEAGERAEIAEVAAKRMGTNNPAFGGARIAKIGSGTFNSHQAWMEYAKSNDMNAQALLAMHDGSRSELIRHIKTSDDPEAKVALQRITDQIAASDELKAKAGGDLQAELSRSDLDYNNASFTGAISPEEAAAVQIKHDKTTPTNPTTPS